MSLLWLYVSSELFLHSYMVYLFYRQRHKLNTCSKKMKVKERIEKNTTGRYFLRPKFRRGAENYQLAMKLSRTMLNSLMHFN